MRLKREDTILVCIDFQGRLMPAMADSEEVIALTAKLVEGCKVLGVPVLVTEQNPKGLEVTVPEIEEKFDGSETKIEKKEFSCMANPAFKKALAESGRKTVLITGCETHVCVQQTCLDMIDAGYNVFVISDCVSSRKKYMRNIALHMMRDEGCRTTSWESALFDLLGSADDPDFKTISKLVK